MNREETALLLGVMQTYDQRTVGEGDVLAWHRAVGDLQFNECRDAVVEHYREQTDRVMPANVRMLVTTSRRMLAGEQRREQIEAAHPARREQELVPMPDWFRSTMEEHRRRARAEREQAEDDGGPVSFGSAIVTALDGMRRRPDGAW